MQKEQLEGQWQQLKTLIKQKWNKLSDNDLNQINGKYDALCSSIQKAYGCKKEQAEQQIRDFRPETTASKAQAQGQPRQGQPQGQPQRQGQPQQGQQPRQGQPGQQPQQQRERGSEPREKVRL